MLRCDARPAIVRVVVGIDDDMRRIQRPVPLDAAIARLEEAVNEARVRRLVSPDALTARIAAEKGTVGIERLRRAGGVVRSGVTRSRLEGRFRALCRRAQVLEHHRNVTMRIAGHVIEADAVWVDRRVIVELDGRDTHTLRRSFYADRERDFALVAEGWKVIRLTWRHVTVDAARTAGRLRALVGA